MTIQVNAAVSTGPARQVDRSRLARYATAAAGVAAGAAVGVGEAAVVTSAPGTVWTGTMSGVVVPPTGPFTITSTATNNAWGDALLDSQFKARVRRGGTGANFTFTAYGSSTFDTVNFRNAFMEPVAGGQIARAQILASGAVIGAGGAVGAWVGTRSGASSILDPGAADFRPYNNPAWGMPVGTGAASVRGFLAFRLAAGGGDYYYGYFDVEYSRNGTQNGSSFTMTVHSWAYENQLNQSITIGGASAVPGGAGLAALAFGAAGLRGRRRGRN